MVRDPSWTAAETAGPGIRVGVVGAGNCALALCRAVQRLHGEDNDRDLPAGFPCDSIGGLRPWDLNIVCAVDVDTRKVGRPLAEALTAPPNSVDWASDIVLDPERFPCLVTPGPILDGAPTHLTTGSSPIRYLPHGERAAAESVRRLFRSTQPEVVVLYLPTGSTRAAAFYANETLRCSSALVNCTPANLACARSWAVRFAKAKLPLLGDDIKSQFGTTAVHQALAAILSSRGGVEIQTYQLNAGGNADHLNLSDPTRQKHKARTKGAPLHRVAAEMFVGPIDNVYLPWAGDRKRSHIHLRAHGRLGHVVDVDVLLQVEDSPNSAAVVLDAVRYAAVARRLGLGGALHRGAEPMMKCTPQHGVGFDLPT